jgi:hypothetical protein
MEKKVCNVCKFEKALDDFSKRTDRKSLWKNECKKCAACRTSSWRATQKPKKEQDNV